MQTTKLFTCCQSQLQTKVSTSIRRRRKSMCTTPELGIVGAAGNAIFLHLWRLVMQVASSFFFLRQPWHRSHIQAKPNLIQCHLQLLFIPSLLYDQEANGGKTRPRWGAILLLAYCSWNSKKIIKNHFPFGFCFSLRKPGVAHHEAKIKYPLKG